MREEVLKLLRGVVGSTLSTISLFKRNEVRKNLKFERNVTKILENFQKCQSIYPESLRGGIAAMSRSWIIVTYYQSFET